MKLTMNTKKVVYIFLCVYFFCLIYAPPFVSINTFHFVSLFSFIAILTVHRHRVGKTMEKMKIKLFFSLIICITFLFVLGCGVTYIRNINIENVQHIYLFYQCIFMLIEMLICCIYIGCVICKYQINSEMFFKLILMAGFVQFLLVIVAYLVPDIRYLFLDIMGKNTDMTKLYTNYNEFLNYRGYGFAINLLDEFGYGTGIIGGIAYIFGRNDKKYYIIAALMVIATLLNSRTGLIMFAVFVICDWMMGKSTKLTDRKVIQLLGICCLLVLLWVVVLPTILQYIFQNTKEEIIKNTVRDLIQVLKLNYHTLRPEMWKFEKDILALLFGTGAIVTGTVSTVGYVNIIWGFGIIGTMVVYCICSVFFLRTMYICRHNPFQSKIVLALFIVFFVIQLKMPVLNYSAGGVLLFSIPLWITLLNKQERNC